MKVKKQNIDYELLRKFILWADQDSIVKIYSDILGDMIMPYNNEFLQNSKNQLAYFMKLIKKYRDNDISALKAETVRKEKHLKKIIKESQEN